MLDIVDSTCRNWPHAECESLQVTSNWESSYQTADEEGHAESTA